VALAQERERGAWPACYDELWQALTGRYDASEAAKQMVDVLMLTREHGPAGVELAVRGALAAGAIDGRAVAVLARRAAAPERATQPTPTAYLAALLEAETAERAERRKAVPHAQAPRRVPLHG